MTALNLAGGMLAACLVWLVCHELRHQLRRRARARQRALAVYPFPRSLPEPPRVRVIHGPARWWNDEGDTA